MKTIKNYQDVIKTLNSDINAAIEKFGVESHTVNFLVSKLNDVTAQYNKVCDCDLIIEIPTKNINTKAINAIATALNASISTNKQAKAALKQAKAAAVFNKTELVFV